MKIENDFSHILSPDACAILSSKYSLVTSAFQKYRLLELAKWLSKSVVTKTENMSTTKKHVVQLHIIFKGMLITQTVHVQAI